MSRGDIDSEYFAGGLPDLTDRRIAFGGEVLARALANIYRKRFDVRTEIEPNLFRAAAEMLNRAAATGIADAVEDGAPMPDDRFLQAVEHGNEVFSAFRTHRMQNDIARLMTDGKGHLKPFAQFAEDALPYTGHKNRAWLKTEYDTAVIRAHRAAEWRQFEDEKDVLPNLEWLPSTSPNPGADHRVFWGTVRPVDDPFWNEHKPGDRWNCKCGLRNTDKDATAVPDSGAKDMPAHGLENNPGRDGRLFSDRHGYFPESCGTCPFAGNRLKALLADLAGKKDCYACKRVDLTAKKAKNESDITEKLTELHTLSGADYTKALKGICSMNVFKPMPNLKSVYWTGNATDLDLENLKNAASKAVQLGNTVYILPNPGKTRTPDFIFVRKGIYKDYDLKTISGKSSVGNRLHESIGQTRRVLLNMNVDYNPRNLAKEIKGYFEENADALEVLIYKNKRSISIDRDKVKSNDYTKNFLKEWAKQKR